MSGRENDALPSGLTAEQVGDFLIQNPDFLARNPEVLKSMIAPSRWNGQANGQGIADMQQFMLEQLRGEVDNLRECAQDVIETSRTNMSIQMRTHTAVLALLSATSFDQMLRVIDDDFSLLLDIDVAIIGFEPPRDPVHPFSNKIAVTSVRRFAKGDTDLFIGTEQDVILIRDMDDDGTLFGEAAGLAQSAAIARIRPGRHSPMGLLALGSRGSVFYPGQGTEMIGFLARVLERCIDRWHLTEN